MILISHRRNLKLSYLFGDLRNYMYLISMYMDYCRRLGLFSACAYKLRLQETMHLTDNVRLTSGIIVAMPSMRKH